MKRCQRAGLIWIALPPPVRIMAAIVFVALVLWVLPARADRIAHNGENELRLMTTACDVPAVLAEVGPTLGAKMHKARAVVDGNTFLACWVEHQGSVYVIYDDADRSVIPAAAFKEEAGA